MAAAFVLDLDIEDEDQEPVARIDVYSLREPLLKRYTRLDRETFKYVLDLIRPQLDKFTRRSNAITSEVMLFVTLVFYASGGFQWLNGLCTRISQPSVSRIIKIVTEELCTLVPRFIKFPTSEADRARTMQEFAAIAHMPRVLGVIGCTHIDIQKPKGVSNTVQFINRHQNHSVNVQAVCDAKLRFTSVLANYPGSNHDSYIWQNSGLCRKFESGTIQNGWLLGDSGYPLQPWLMIPLRNPVTPAESRYQEAHIKTRNPIERCFGLLKSRFRCLHKTDGILAYEPTKVCKIMVACCVLHNICIERRCQCDPGAMVSRAELNEVKAEPLDELLPTGAMLSRAELDEVEGEPLDELLPTGEATRRHLIDERFVQTNDL